MQKQKFKINILDIAIFVVILCCVAVLIFRDTINDYFGEPEITHISVTVAFENALPAAQVNATEGIDAVFKPIKNGDLKLDARIRKLVVAEDSVKSQITISCKGYKKLGRFYTESGELISLGSECSIGFAGAEANGKITKVEVLN